MSTQSLREGPVADVTLLSAKCVADLLGVHPRSVWRMAQTGEIPQPIRLSERVVRWRLSDLRDYLDEKAAGARSARR